MYSNPDKVSFILEKLKRISGTDELRLSRLGSPDQSVSVEKVKA